MGAIKTGHTIPGNCTDGTIVYIYKNKGAPCGFGNYIPIFLTRTIYKILPMVITRKLTNIAQILKRNNQFGYKEGTSTIDAIITIEHYVEHAKYEAEILPMGAHRAFDTINRTILWATLYTKWLPIEMTNRIRR